MTGLIILLILVPIIFLLLLISIQSKTSAQKEVIDSLNKKINHLSEQLSELIWIIKEREQKPKENTLIKEPEKKIADKELEKSETVPQPEIKSIPEKKISFVAEPAITTEQKPVTVSTTEEIMPDEQTQVVPKKEKENWWNTWLQNNPDLEKFIGENLANKIGIAILVLGIAFFVKYAIDKDWINETGRVAIGILCGGILTGFAHFFRKSYRSFSSVLTGGGLAVFYFTIAFAFHQYHLMSQQAAFIIMIIITVFAIVLSLLYDRLELAILSVIGGFITPFLVSTGEGNYIVLFSYLCILNSGVMVLAYFKKWPAINSIALIFTVLIYGGWLTDKLLSGDLQNFPYVNAFLFASVFYIIFMIMNLINNLRLKRSFSGFDFCIVLSTNFLYYSAGMIILGYWHNGDYKGLFTAFLGAVNLCLAWLFFRNTKADKNFIYLLIGLTLTFISLAAPVQLKGNYITLFWSAEAVVLLWLFQQSRIKLIKVASALVTVLSVISLLMDWSQIYFAFNDSSLPIIANKGYVTSVIVACSLFIHYQLMKKEADSYYLANLTNKAVRNALLSSSLFVAYASGMLEIWFQFTKRIPGTEIYSVYMQLYTFVFAIILLVAYKGKKSSLLQFSVVIYCFAFYLLFLGINYAVIRNIIETGNNKIHLLPHWINALLLLKLLYDMVIYFKKNHVRWKSNEAVFTWFVTTAVVLLLSIEIHHFIIWINYSKETNWVYWQNLYYKSGLSILWGLCSFTIMWLGMKYKFRTLRVISLTLFSVTLIKLFGYDIRNIPPGGKIAAFILLGVLLLTISFMYQRLKKMIIDDAKEEK